MITFLGLTAVLVGCGQRSVYANFDYGEYISIKQVEPDRRIPTIDNCIAHIEENGYYACVTNNDGEFISMLVDVNDDIIGHLGAIYFLNDDYIVISPDRDTVTAAPVLRLSKLFPQGREGIYGDCMGFNDDTILVVQAGQSTFYDLELSQVDPLPLPEIECSVFKDMARFPTQSL